MLVGEVTRPPCAIDPGASVPGHTMGGWCPQVQQGAKASRNGPAGGPS